MIEKKKLEEKNQNTNKSGQASNVEWSKCIGRVRNEREKERERSRKTSGSIDSSSNILYVVDLYRINSLSLSASVFFVVFLLLPLLRLLVVVAEVCALFCCCSYIFHGSRHFFPIIVVFLRLCTLAHTLYPFGIFPGSTLCGRMLFWRTFSRCTKLCGKYQEKHVRTHRQMYGRTNE